MKINTKLKFKKAVLKTIQIVIAGLPLISLAQRPDRIIPGIEPAPLTTLGGLEQTIKFIVVWMSFVFWVLAVGFLIWAAFTYLRAGGSDDMLKKAKARVLYAVIAAFIALLANGIQAIAGSLLRGN